MGRESEWVVFIYSPKQGHIVPVEMVIVVYFAFEGTFTAVSVVFFTACVFGG
jgi:hypothetical protein